jgi:group I intron endonuclease
MIVYKATNKVNGKGYVGSTTKTFTKRQHDHYKEALCYDSQHAFHRAIRKYGWDNFEWCVLFEGMTSEKEMYNYEHLCNLTHCTYTKYDRGYNMTLCYDNTTLGYKFTEDQRKKTIRYGDKNSNYGNKWSQKQKDEASKRQKIVCGHLIGDNNPSRRPEVRKKLSDDKLGGLNPNADHWLITSPEGIEYKLHGGLKRFLKEHNVNYSCILKVIHGLKSNHKGWVVKRILEKESNEITER